MSSKFNWVCVCVFVRARACVHVYSFVTTYLLPEPTGVYIGFTCHEMIHVTLQNRVRKNRVYEKLCECLPWKKISPQSTVMCVQNSREMIINKVIWNVFLCFRRGREAASWQRSPHWGKVSLFWRLPGDWWLTVLPVQWWHQGHHRNPRRRRLKNATALFRPQLTIGATTNRTLAGWIFYEKWHEQSEIF